VERIIENERSTMFLHSTITQFMVVHDYKVLLHFFAEIVFKNKVSQISHIAVSPFFLVQENHP